MTVFICLARHHDISLDVGDSPYEYSYITPKYNIRLESMDGLQHSRLQLETIAYRVWYVCRMISNMRAFLFQQADRARPISPARPLARSFDTHCCPNRTRACISCQYWSLARSLVFHERMSVLDYQSEENQCI